MFAGKVRARVATTHDAVHFHGSSPACTTLYACIWVYMHPLKMHWLRLRARHTTTDGRGGAACVWEFFVCICVPWLCSSDHFRIILNIVRVCIATLPYTPYYDSCWWNWLNDLTAGNRAHTHTHSHAQHACVNQLKCTLWRMTCTHIHICMVSHNAHTHTHTCMGIYRATMCPAKPPPHQLVCEMMCDVRKMLRVSRAVSSSRRVNGISCCTHNDFLVTVILA